MRRFNDLEVGTAEEMTSLKKAQEMHNAIGSPIVTRPGVASEHPEADEAPHKHIDEEFTPSFLSCCRTFKVVFAAVLTIVLVFGVSMTSGTYAGGSTPKVAIVVFEGLRGDLFQQMIVDGSKAPFLKELLKSEVSSFAPCYGVDDSQCARTQSGVDLGPGHTFHAGPGIASILTGVNAQRHQVSNDSSMANFAKTAAHYPSLPMYLKNKGLNTAAVGTSKLLTTLSTQGTCTNYGILDYECGADLVQRCFRSQACNLDSRVITPTSGDYGAEEINMVGGITDALLTNPDLLIFHTSKLARGVADATRPNFAYDPTSKEYMGQLYQLDAVVGQLVAELKTRAQKYRENWLLIGTSAHGGLGKDSGTISGWDEIIPFFVAPLTSAPIRVNPLSSPATQMDVFPTALRWFGFDLPTNVTLDGQVQAICTDGATLTNCTN